MTHVEFENENKELDVYVDIPFQTIRIINNNKHKLLVLIFEAIPIIT